jgi:hypothetical protein
MQRFFTLAVSMGIGGLLAVGHPAEVRAQTVFCPATFPGTSTRTNTTPVALANGSCTNGQDGAFSGAALASQALSELSQTTTQATTKEIGKSIAERREQERERCPAGFSRVDGACRRLPVAEPERAVPPERRVAPERPARVVPTEKPTAAARKIERRAPPPPPIEPAARFGTWIQVFGDYQKRDAAGPATLNCCIVANIPFNGVQPALGLNIQARIGTVGFVGGADLTSRGLFSANDGLIAGVTAGYTSSLLKLNTSAAVVNDFGSGAQQVMGTGVNSTRATVSGPTTGLYATYFNAGFSTDVAVKFDFLTLSETFNDSLATTGNAAGDNNGVPAFLPFAGSGSADLLNSSVIGNLNYRFDLYPNFWIEPTVGAVYTNSSYGSGAAQLGLRNGNLVRVQGGARFGTSTVIGNGVLMTTTLTGLAYNDVMVEGGFIPASAFQGNNLLIQADQGLMRGEGILAFNFNFGGGMSSFVQGDVYGGAHLIGAGGKAGVRYQW